MYHYRLNQESIGGGLLPFNGKEKKVPKYKHDIPLTIHNEYKINWERYSKYLDKLVLKLKDNQCKFLNKISNFNLLIGYMNYFIIPSRIINTHSDNQHSSFKLQ